MSICFFYFLIQVLFGPPAYMDSNSVLVLTENRDLFLFGLDQVESKDQEIGDMVQVQDIEITQDQYDRH